MNFRDIQVTPVFEKNFNSVAKIPVNRGGARSSKSYSLAQLFVQRFTSQQNKKILVARKTFKSCVETCKKLIYGLLKDYDYFRYCETRDWGDLYYKPTNSFFRFSGALDVEKIKSTEWNYEWLEEANEFTYYDYDILKMRLSAPTVPGERNQIFLSLNPESAFSWIKTQVLDVDPNAEDIPSSFMDNPFLDDDYIQNVILPLKRHPTKWRVFGLGEWGVLEHSIYPNWNTVQPNNWPQSFDDTIYGLDFGFNVESGLVELNFKDGVVYERELLYDSGLTNSDLIKRAKSMIPEHKRSCYLFADSAEPDRIQEFCSAGFNCHPADKSVKVGIDHVMSCDVRIHAESTNLIKEKRGYSWKMDKEGKPLDEPIKWQDHLVDAERYGLYSYHKILGEGRPQFRLV